MRCRRASALIMLAGIYYGAQYGGSTTAILVNLPGEASSVVTCIDGYQMARQGRAGPALAIAAIGSFIAGTAATLFCALLAAPMAAVATKFGPAEYFSLMVLGLIGAVVIAHRSVLKAIGMVIVGLILGLVGIDVNSGAHRFTFGVVELYDGIGFIVVAVGVFAICEIVANLEQREQPRSLHRSRSARLMPTRDDLKQSAMPIVRGTLVGSVLGILPAGGALLASFASYALEKKVAKDPSRFGKGAIEGVAGPEAANNAGAQTCFIPMLTLGIPPNVVMALMIGAMMIHNIQPGPQVMTKNPELFWGLIASMWIGNLMLVVLNLPLVGIWVKLLSLALPVPLSGDHPVLLHRRLHAIEQHLRRASSRAVRGTGLPVRQDWLRASAHAAGLRAGAHDGGVFPPRSADRARRFPRVHRAPDQRGSPGRRAGGAHLDVAARDQ